MGDLKQLGFDIAMVVFAFRAVKVTGDWLASLYDNWLVQRNIANDDLKRTLKIKRIALAKALKVKVDPDLEPEISEVPPRPMALISETPLPR